MKTRTIVHLHGMFTDPLCWENWIPYYESKDHKVIAPAWPGRDKFVEERRKAHPDSEFEAFPRSAKRAILEWISSAKKPETRAQRSAETVAKAEQNIRANQWRQ